MYIVKSKSQIKICPNVIIGKRSHIHVVLSSVHEVPMAKSRIVLVLDNSNSMYGSVENNMWRPNNKMEVVKATASGIAEGVLSGNSGSIAMVVFGSDIIDSTGFWGSGEIQEFRHYLEQIDRYGRYVGAEDPGGTNLQIGLYTATNMLARFPGQGEHRAIVLFADGEPTYSYRLRSAEAVAGGYRFTACDMCCKVGSGYCYELGHHRYRVRLQRNWFSSGVLVNDNGIATLWQAEQAMTHGIHIYTVFMGGNSRAAQIASQISVSGECFAIEDNLQSQEKIERTVAAVLSGIDTRGKGELINEDGN